MTMRMVMSVVVSVILTSGARSFGDEPQKLVTPANPALKVARETREPNAGEAQRLRDLANTHFRAGKLDLAIDAMSEAVSYDSQNPLLHYVLSYMQHRSGRLDDAIVTVNQAVELEKRNRLANWHQALERYQGPSRTWLEDARRNPPTVKKIVKAPEAVATTVPPKATVKLKAPEPIKTEEPAQPAPAVAVTKPATIDAPQDAAPVLDFIGAIDEDGNLATFQTFPSPAEEIITRDLLINGKPITITEKKRITVFPRVPLCLLPPALFTITNVKGEPLADEQLRKAVKGNTLVLVSPQPVDPRYLKIIKPDTLIVKRIPHGPPMAAPAPARDAAPAPAPAPPPPTEPKAQIPAPTNNAVAASCGEDDEAESAHAAKISEPMGVSRMAVSLSGMALATGHLRSTFSGDSPAASAVPLTKRVPMLDNEVAMLWDHHVGFNPQFPVEAPPILAYVTGLDENRTLTIVGSVFEKTTRMIQEYQLTPDGREVPAALAFPVHEEQRKLKAVTHRLGSATFVSLKTAAVSKGGHGDIINLTEARRRIGNGAAVLLAYGELPDPRYLSLFRDDTLLIVSRRQSVEVACTPTGIVCAPSSAAPSSAAPSFAAPAFPPQIDAHIAGLIAQLNDADANVRNSAQHALCELSPWAKAAIPALVKALNEEASAPFALMALRFIGPSARSAVPAVSKLLSNDDKFLRFQAAHTLCEIDRDAAKVAVPVVLESLKSAEKSGQYGVADLLVRLAPDQAELAVPVLLEWVQDPSYSWSFINSTTFESRNPIVGAALVPVLLENLRNSPPELIHAAESQSRIGRAIVVAHFAPDHANVVVPFLVEGLSFQTQFVQNAAAAALLSLTSDFDSARDILLRNLRPPMVWQVPPKSFIGKSFKNTAQYIAQMQGSPADVAEARQLLLDKLRLTTPQDRYLTFFDWADCRLVGNEALLPLLKEFETDPDEVIQEIAKAAAAKIKSTPATPRPVIARASSDDVAKRVRSRVIQPIAPSVVIPAPTPAPAPAPAPKEEPPPPPPAASASVPKLAPTRVEELAADVVLARAKELQPHAVMGFAKVTQAGSGTLDWVNFRGQMGPAHLIRQQVVGQTLEWETSAVPETAKDDNENITLMFAGSFGWFGRPKANGFVLLLNGQDSARWFAVNPVGDVTRLEIPKPVR